MVFTCETGITKYEDSNLNMSPEGKMRRKLMNDHATASKKAATGQAYVDHYIGKSMNTKLLNEKERRK